jgi:hypothetical protein
MTNKNKTRIVFMVTFAIFALGDIISTFLAISTGHASEANIVGAELISMGSIGYLFFYLYLLVFAGILAALIDLIFWANGELVGNRLSDRNHTIAYTFMSLGLSLVQLMAIINNLTIFIK